MLKYDITVNEEFQQKLFQKLRVGEIEDEILNETVSYFYINAQVMDRIIEGFHLWVGDEKLQGEQALFILQGMLKMMNLLRKNLEKRDGITSLYLSRINISARNRGHFEQWQFEGQREQYDGLKGIFKSLRNMNLDQEFIDRFYLDGNLLELYDECIEIVSALYYLTITRNPSPSDLMEGLFIIEGRLQKLYNRLFFEEFEEMRGLYNCLQSSLEKIEKERKEKHGS